MNISNILILILIIGGIIYFQHSKKKVTPKEKAGDWLKVKEIDEEGFLQTEDDRFMVMLEVFPVSFALKSPMEQKAIWSAFRESINMIPHPVRLRTESHPYDLDEYFHDLKGKALDNGDMNDQKYVLEMKETFSQFVEQNQIQDRRYYMFLETDQRFLAELNAEISNPLLNDLLKKNVASKNPSDNQTVKQELGNSVRVVESTLHNVGLFTRRLGREDVHAYLYNSCNRDMATVVPYQNLERAATEGDQVISLVKAAYHEG